MDGLNQAFTVGNLCDDADHRETQHGRHVARFRVATSTTYTDANNTRKTSVQYVPCVWWGTRPKGAAPFLVKGARVAIVGRLETSSYEDAVTHKTHHRMEVVVSDLTFERIPGKTTSAPAEPPQADDDFGGMEP